MWSLLEMCFRLIPPQWGGALAHESCPGLG